MSHREHENGRSRPVHRVEYFLLFLIFSITLSVYYGSLAGEFLDIDDHGYVTDNEYIRDLSWRGIGRIFTSVIAWNYFPLQILSYALDFHFWGLNPFGYRLGNLIFHIGNAFLVFYFLRRLTGGKLWISLLGSLCFAVHPVNVESVAWISERKNVLSAFFLLLSFLTYFRYLDGERKGLAYALSLILYLLSVLGKVSCVVFPLLLILYDTCFTGRPLKERIKDKIPFLLISAFFSGLAVYIYHVQRVIPPYHGGTPAVNFLTMAKVIPEYILSLFLPIYLNFYYHTDLVQSVWNVQLLLSLSILVFLAFLAVRWHRTDRPLFFALLFFFLPLLPVLNIVPIAILRADRYLYLPSIGFSFFLVCGILRVADCWKRKYPWPGLAILCGIVAIYGFICERQTQHWQNSFHLWSRVMKYIPGEPIAYRSLGNYARDKGKLDLAILYYQQGLQGSPNDESFMNNLGDVYLAKGQVEKAHAFFQDALKRKPDYPDALVNMGIVYSRSGQDLAAIHFFEEARKDKKTRAAAANNLGVIYQKQGDRPKAAAAFREAVRDDASLVSAYNNLARSLLEEDRADEALAVLHRGLQANPGSFDILFALGRFYLEKRAPNRAAVYLVEALKSRPEDPETNFGLAVALALLPDNQQAARFHLEKALRNEKDPKLHANMQKRWGSFQRDLESVNLSGSPSRNGKEHSLQDPQAWIAPGGRPMEIGKGAEN